MRQFGCDQDKNLAEQGKSWGGIGAGGTNVKLRKINAILLQNTGCSRKFWCVCALLMYKPKYHISFTFPGRRLRSRKTRAVGGWRRTGGAGEGGVISHTVRQHAALT